MMKLVASCRGDEAVVSVLYTAVPQGSVLHHDTVYLTVKPTPLSGRKTLIVLHCQFKFIMSQITFYS